MKSKWGEGHDIRLRVLWPIFSMTRCAQILHVHRTTVADHAVLLGLPPKRKSKQFAPPHDLWRFHARQVAREARIGAKEVLGFNSSKMVAEARWKAWKRLLDENPQYSIAGLGRTSGWDHTTILTGLRRLDGCTPYDLRNRLVSRASGRRRPKPSIVA